MCFCGAEEIIGILKQVIRKAISIAQTDYKNENCPHQDGTHVYWAKSHSLQSHRRLSVSAILECKW